ncbi:MAG: hypothetical protein K2M14_06475 [Muribaculaceae bacterium]|nr:hypothetical protein [Muribaculaceae bacterium]
MKTIQKLLILLIAFLAFAPTATGNVIADTQSEEALELTKSAFDYLEAQGYSPRLQLRKGQLRIVFTVEGHKIINLRCVNEVNDKGFIIQLWLARDLKALGFSNEKGLDVANEINFQYARVKSCVTGESIIVDSTSFISNFYQFTYQIPEIITAILAGDDIILKRYKQGK